MRDFAGLDKGHYFTWGKLPKCLAALGSETPGWIIYQKRSARTFASLDNVVLRLNHGDIYLPVYRCSKP